MLLSSSNGKCQLSELPHKSTRVNIFIFENCEWLPHWNKERFFTIDSMHQLWSFSLSFPYFFISNSFHKSFLSYSVPIDKIGHQRQLNLYLLNDYLNKIYLKRRHHDLKFLICHSYRFVSIIFLIQLQHYWINIQCFN